jgi:Ca2+-binding EF-hand superfamily protein
LLADVMRLAPPDPLQYMIDALTLGAAAAQQDPELGLPRHRREKLERVFASIDSAGTGRLSLRSLQAYANAHGGETLTNADARAIFGDFKPGAGELVGLGQFLAFFAHASRTMGNASFDAMVGEMGAR